MWRCNPAARQDSLVSISPFSRSCKSTSIVMAPAVCTRGSARVAAQQQQQPSRNPDVLQPGIFFKESTQQQLHTGKQRKPRGVTPAAEQLTASAAPQQGSSATTAAAASTVPNPNSISDGSSSSSRPAAPAAKRQTSSNRRKPASNNSSTAKAAAGAASGPSRAAEQAMWAKGHVSVAGVDEAGRGPLAGPVVAAAAVLPEDIEFAGLNDSKQMSEEAREALYEQLTSHPDVKWAVAVVDRETIDEINILQAAMLAMQQAVEGLGSCPDAVLVDGNRRPKGLEHLPMQTLVKGDATSTCIAAASVIAKVTRDRLMLQLDAQFPQYGFAQHKGYGVPAHKAAIQQHGPCPEHRRSFEPVKAMTGWAGYGQKAKAAAAAAAVAAADEVAGAVAAATAEVKVLEEALEQKTKQKAAGEVDAAAAVPAAAAQDLGQGSLQQGSRKRQPKDQQQSQSLQQQTQEDKRSTGSGSAVACDAATAAAAIAESKASRKRRKA